MTELDRSFGRIAFGEDPANYDAARPPYPGWVFDTLKDRCGVGAGSATFEIGPGTGTATRMLLELGADPLFAVEPDRRLADFLAKRTLSAALKVIVSPFETADLPDRRFDLGFCATAFHWLPEDAALARIGLLLRPGGWWAALWNVYGDESRPDPFHEATQSLFGEGPLSRSGSKGEIPFGLDAKARMAAIERTGVFSKAEHLISSWQLSLDTDQMVALYATFSNITVRTDRLELLEGLRRVADEQFDGRVTRNMTTSLYIAHRL
jgi:SAM-dependent methyltransferase